MTAPVAPVYFPCDGDWNAVVDPSLSNAASTPIVQPVSALVAFHPRVPTGFVAYIDNFAISGDVNAVQTVSILGPVNSGTFKLQVLGVWTPTAIPYTAAGADLQTALEGCSTVGAGNVIAQGASGGPWAVEFTNDLGNQPVPAMVPDYSLLGSAGGQVVVTVEPTTLGSSARTAPSALAVTPRQGRIWNGRLCNIDVADTPTVMLLANMPELNLAALDINELIYDVTFSQVTYGAAKQDLSNFAFAAPSDASPINITDPDLPRLSWQPPS